MMDRTTDILTLLREVLRELRGIRRAVEASSSPEAAARLGPSGAGGPHTSPDAGAGNRRQPVSLPQTSPAVSDGSRGLFVGAEPFMFCVCAWGAALCLRVG